MNLIFRILSFLIVLTLLLGVLTPIQALNQPEVLRIQRFALHQLYKYLQDDATDASFSVFFEGFGNPVVSLTLDHQGAEYVWTYTRLPVANFNNPARPVEWMTLTISTQYPHEDNRVLTRETHFIDDHPFGTPAQMTVTYSERTPKGLVDAKVDIANMEQSEEKRLVQSQYDEALKIFLDYVNSFNSTERPPSPSKPRNTI